ncbi:AI-2E family transporter [Rhodoferax sp.]|uniref:AI-2E family transporter n=1 Tax=Rhodoferax sp. TaxID=50421 RepID=UPI0027770189|nr:AI-2E family transporter [Rhodoferax sp.]
MTPPNDHAPGLPANKFLLLLLVMVSGAFAWILLPFYGTIMWAAIIGLLFRPVYRWLLLRLPRRPTAAALLTVLLVLVIVILPLALITASLAREAAQVYQGLKSGALNPVLYLHGVFDALPGWITTVLARFDLSDFATLQNRLTAALAQGSQFIATQALGIGQNTFEFVASLFITLYLAFFLIRDGDSIARTIRPAIALPPQHTRELLGKFTAVILATVKGNLLVAAIQGALGGLAFWFLGVSAALLWAVLMAFLSLLPAVGAALVWLPVALYFLINGAIWQGVALVAYGVLVIGLVDNLLRPILVGKDAGMPDYLVMITTLGGMAVFGINGFVIGPVIAAMFIAVWHIHGVSRRGN